MTENPKSPDPPTQSHEDRQHALDRKRYTVERWTLFFLFIYVSVAAFQYCALLGSNKINRDALTSVQRAFVFVQSPKEDAIDVFGPPGNQLFQVTFRFENGGTTPTRNLRSHLNWRIQHEPIDQNFSFVDQAGKDINHMDTPAVLGPKSYFGLTTDSMTTKYLDEMLGQRAYLYLWGWAQYNDVFEKTPQHVTRFCYALVPTAASKDERTKLVTMRYRFNNCPYYTCADQDCKQ